jgi:gamma-glutamylcyclotransferase (GGCT)/AIG2-like uncharacterized protein YtfP
LKISPKYTADDWITLRTRLNEPFERSAWEEAIAFAEDRISNRFLEPVKILLSHDGGTKLGFGFAILALDCLLIDTLQSFREGRTSGGEASSTSSFIEFLVNRQRFKSEFISKTMARDFFECVRCGLLHDGETRKGWLVHAKSDDGRILKKTRDGWILYRNHFHAALKEEFSDYLTELLEDSADSALRAKFLMRMDTICGMLPESKSVVYFAYGSNMDRDQMESRVPGALYIGAAKLPNYRLVFNKRSHDGSGKANIASAKPGDSEVWGAVFELSKEQITTLANIEKGYFLRKDLSVVMSSGEKKHVALFCAEPSETQTLAPSAEYLKKILSAAKSLSLPPDYQETLKVLAQSSPSHA